MNKSNPDYSQRRSSRIGTYSGGSIDPINPNSSDIDIVDIAHSLSLQCRFTGHVDIDITREYYSVAEHSLLVSRLVDQEFALWGLLHDATEAYISDISSPVKPYVNGYKEIEHQLMSAIAERFGLSMPIPDKVITADREALTIEALQLMDTSNRELWSPWLIDDARHVRLDCMLPHLAKHMFLTTYESILDNG